MRTIVVVDTSVFLNVLDVPAYNQNREEVLTQLGQFVAQDVNMLLPLAAIVETGNHMADLADGRLRRKFATIFSNEVKKAIDGTAPWTPTQGVETAALAIWLDEFPDYAMRGLGLGDLSIVKEFDAACIRHPNFRVMIWSLDNHLVGYDRPAHSPKVRRP
jgi:hypothetical protein